MAVLSGASTLRRAHAILARPGAVSRHDDRRGADRHRTRQDDIGRAQGRSSPGRVRAATYVRYGWGSHGVVAWRGSGPTQDGSGAERERPVKFLDKGLTATCAVRYAALTMEDANVTLPVEDARMRTNATGCSCIPLSSSWYYFWFTNPPAALAGRFGCTGED